MRSGRAVCSMKQRRFIHALRDDRANRSTRTLARLCRISPVALDEWSKSRLFRTTLGIALRGVSRSRRLAIETDLIRFALRRPLDSVCQRDVDFRPPVFKQGGSHV